MTWIDLSLVVDHKHRIGFEGPILIEPKPNEPTKHQCDFDAATVYGFLRRYGLEKEVKLNLDVTINHCRPGSTQGRTRSRRMVS